MRVWLGDAFISLSVFPISYHCLRDWRVSCGKSAVILKAVPLHVVDSSYLATFSSLSLSTLSITIYLTVIQLKLFIKNSLAGTAE